MGNRLFEYPELKMLTDAVASVSYTHLLRGRPRGGITAGLRPLHRGGGLQLVHLCAGADGGTVRNGGADGGVPPSGGIARNAWTQGKELDGFDRCV